MLKSSVEDKVNKVLLLLLSIGQPHNLPAQSGCVALTLDIVYTNRPLSSAEAFYSRALGKNIPAARGGWEEEKLKRSPRTFFSSLQRFRSRFFLWCLLTGASAEERANRQTTKDN